MARRELTVLRYEEIKRLLSMGISIRKISQALRCSKTTVRKVRDGDITVPRVSKELSVPIWVEEIDWGKRF